MGTETPPRTRDRQQLIAWASRQKKAPLSVAQAAAMDSVYPAWRQTPNGVWFTKLEAVEAFFASNRRFPRATCDDPAEKRIGIWLTAQRAKSELLSTERKKVIDERLPGWDTNPRDSTWNQKLSALVEFISAHGRMPRTNEEDKAARTIGIWLSTQRHTSDMPDHRREQLDVKVPGWSHAAEEKWKEEFDFVVAYFAQHGRLPSHHPEDPRLEAAATWVRTQRANLANMPQQRVDSLDAAFPNWRLRNADKWTVMLDYVTEFARKQDRFPNSKSSDKAEARAGAWFTNQRSGTSMTREREAALDSRLPRWRESAKDMAWHRKLRATESFYRSHGRRPLPDAADPAEKALGMWYRNNAATNTASAQTPERRAAWESADFGDRRSRSQIWDDSLQAVTRFRAEHGRFPFPSGKEPGEERVGRWLGYQRSAKMDSERRKKLDGLLPGWDVTLRDQWDFRLEECCNFVAEHLRLPSRSSRDSTPHERKLGQWIADQRIPRAQKRGDRIQLLDKKLPGWRG